MAEVAMAWVAHLAARRVVGAAWAAEDWAGAPVWVVAPAARARAAAEIWAAGWVAEVSTRGGST